MREDEQRALRLYTTADRNGSGRVSESELGFGMRQFGFDVPRRVLLKLFDVLDVDASGQIGFRELNEWTRSESPLSQRLSSLDLASQLK